MATPEGQIPGASGASDALSIAGLPGEDLGWITETAIDNSDVDAGNSVTTAAEAPAEAGAGAEVKEPAASPEEESTETVETAAADETDEAEKAASEEATLEAAAATEQGKQKRPHFIQRYMDADTPEKIEQTRAHLQSKSPSQYAAFESAVLNSRLSQPSQFCADLFQRDPQAYATLAMEVYKGDPATFAAAIAGRPNISADDVKTAVDFWSRNKDRIQDDAVELSQLNEEKLAEFERYFPDEAPAMRKALELAQKAQEAEQNAPGKAEPEKAEAKPDPAADEARLAVQREVSECFDVARDTVADYVTQRAFDPQKGIGVAVSPEERKSAPLLSRLKDVKWNIFSYGLTGSDGKDILPQFQEGFINWGKDRDDFKPVFTNAMRYVNAREKNNVKEVMRGMDPVVELYYNERLKHPIFQEIDQLIAMVAKQGHAAPKFDRIETGAMPAQGGGKKTQGARFSSDDGLIADALGRSG